MSDSLKRTKWFMKELGDVIAAHEAVLLRGSEQENRKCPFIELDMARWTGMDRSSKHGLQRIRCVSKRRHVL